MKFWEVLQGEIRVLALTKPYIGSLSLLKFAATDCMRAEAKIGTVFNLKETRLKRLHEQLCALLQTWNWPHDQWIRIGFRSRFGRIRRYLPCSVAWSIGQPLSKIWPRIRSRRSGACHSTSRSILKSSYAQNDKPSGFLFVGLPLLRHFNPDWVSHTLEEIHTLPMHPLRAQAQAHTQGLFWETQSPIVVVERISHPAF